MRLLLHIKLAALVILYPACQRRTTGASSTLAVVSVSPSDGETGVVHLPTVSVEFSSEVDSNTVSGNVSLVGTSGGSLGVNGNLVTLTPTSSLGLLRTYTATVSNNLKDTAGNTLPEAFLWSFRTKDGTWGTEGVIENDNSGEALNPAVALLPSGNAFVVWAQHDGTQYNIWASRYVVGVGWILPTLIETDNAGSALEPFVAADSNGNAIAIWRQFDGTRYNILANRYVAGVGWGTAELVETYNGGSAFEPKLGFDGNGNAFAVWIQNDGSRNNIWANRYVAGSGWQTAGEIESNNNEATEPHVGVSADGSAIAVWRQTDGTRYNVWMSRYSGTGWSSPALIETNNAGSALLPRVFLDGAGNAMAVWMHYDGVSVYNILANRYQAGVGWSLETTIETDDAGHASTPDVCSNANGYAIAAWFQSDGSRNNVWANRYVPGTGWGTAELIETENLGNAENVRVACDEAGNALAVWEQMDGVRKNIWANRFVSGTGWGTATLIEGVNTGTAVNPQIGIDAGGRAVVVWQHSDGVRYNIWANTFR